MHLLHQNMVIIQKYIKHTRKQNFRMLYFFFFFLISSGCFTDAREIEKCYIQFLLLEVISWSDSREVYFVTWL